MKDKMIQMKKEKEKSMSNIIQTRQAYVEIDEFIGLLEEEDRNKIPPKLRQFFKDEKDSNYYKKINPDIPIKEQNLKEETLALIAILYLKYICEDEKEKVELNEIFKKNEEKYQAELHEKYNTDNIFQNNSKTIIQQSEQVPQQQSLVEVKQGFFAKFVNRIKEIFHVK